MLYVNDVRITPTIFPDGTSQVWNLPNQLCDHKQYTIRWKFENEGEITHVAQLVDLLSKNSGQISLRLDYLPYARQDKEISNNTTFALHSFAKLLNYMDFDYVEILDPHSEEALKLINRSRAVYSTGELSDVIKITNSILLCYPDKGAVTKYKKVYPLCEYIFGEKVRDQQTGRITKYELIGDPKGLNILIVDDICDGGATFVILAKELYQAGAKEVNLFVTHGIFSKGLQPLYDAGIKRIFTADGEAGKGIQNQIAYRRL